MSELFQPNLDRLDEHMGPIMEMFPVLENAEIQRVISGPITYAPDAIPMVGPCQGLHNVWTAVGFR